MTEDSEDSIFSKDGLKFVRRSAWGALQPSFVPTMNRPAKMIMFGYPQQRYAPNGKSWLGFRPSYEAALSEIKFMQKMDVMKYPDIKYNFLICPDGFVFEGRGWNAVPTLPLKYKRYAHVSYYIMFVGDFTEFPPTEEFYITRERLIQHGVENRFISKKFLLYTMESNVKSPYEPYDFNEKKVIETKY